MTARMNTFAVILLAFPLYLAVKGRLAAYVELAKPGASGSSTAGAGTTAAGASSQASTKQTAPSGASLADASSFLSNFGDGSGVVA